MPCVNRQSFLLNTYWSSQLYLLLLIQPVRLNLTLVVLHTVVRAPSRLLTSCWTVQRTVISTFMDYAQQHCFGMASLVPAAAARCTTEQMQHPQFATSMSIHRCCIWLSISPSMKPMSSRSVLLLLMGFIDNHMQQRRMLMLVPYCLPLPVLQLCSTCTKDARLCIDQWAGGISSAPPTFWPTRDTPASLLNPHLPSAY